MVPAWINQDNRDFVSAHSTVNLTEMEKKILKAVNKQLLMSQEELIRTLEGQEIEGAGPLMRKLKDEGFLNVVEPLGKTSIVITQKGMRALK